MTPTFDIADVPTVAASSFEFIMQSLIENEQGLALLRGLSEDEIRVVEGRLWAEFRARPDERVALALRFRALLAVFESRRLKELFLTRGHSLFSVLAREAAAQRLNVRFGFNPQRMLLALTQDEARPMPAPQALAMAA
jgi:hypothetical protein